jgi:integrase
MAYIRKRNLPSGKLRWQVVWKAKGKRVSAMFETQADAKAKKRAVEGSRPGSSAKFRALAVDYLAYMESLVKAGDRERSYLEYLEGHINGHILPDAEFSGTRCCNIGTPEVQLFLNRLIGKVSSSLAVKIRTTLSQVFKYGARVGYVPSNPVRDAETKRKRRPEAGEAEPFVLPGKNSLRALLDGAGTFDNTGRANAVVRTLMYAGPRISELRGLPQTACRLVGEVPNVQIHQRADRYNVIGSVKSSAGRRTLELGPETAQALRLWLLAAPIGEPVRLPDGRMMEPPRLAFPSETGGVWGYPNFRARFWVPLMNHCGLVTDEPADESIRSYVKAWANFRAPIFGPHMLRHVYASLQIEQGVSPKRLQKLMGHSTLKMTMDTYGHLFPDEDADRVRARGVERLL